MESYTEGGKVDSRRLDAGQQYIDIHCHCLPGLDDGPATMADTIALCQALVKDGIGTVVATPHQLGRFDGCNEAKQVRYITAKLNEQLQKEGIKLTVLPGADVRVDERILPLLKAGRILTLAGSKYLLLELPHDIFIDPKLLLSELSSAGITAIISHPERHRVLASQPLRVLKLLEAGACLQITAASILGCFGPLAKKASWYFLAQGWAGIVASDAHDTKQRCPMMKSAFEKIRQKFGEDLARLLVIENPSRVINGKTLEPLQLFEHREVYANEK